jgi:hypothetical protein
MWRFSTAYYSVISGEIVRGFTREFRRNPNAKNRRTLAGFGGLKEWL